MTTGSIDIQHLLSIAHKCLLDCNAVKRREQYSRINRNYVSPPILRRRPLGAAGGGLMDFSNSATRRSKSWSSNKICPTACSVVKFPVCQALNTPSSPYVPIVPP